MPDSKTESSGPSSSYRHLIQNVCIFSKEFVYDICTQCIPYEEQFFLWFWPAKQKSLSITYRTNILGMN